MTASLLSEEATPAAESSSSPAPTEPASEVTAPATGPAPTGNEPAADPAAASEGEQGQEKPQAPSYDGLSLPPGSTLDEAHVTALKEFAGQNGLSEEAAQALVERDQAMVTAQSEAALQGWTKQVNEWKAATEADKEIGGDHLPETIKNAKAALFKHFSPEFAEMVNEKGFGNHPEFIRGLAKIGAADAEPTDLASGGQAAASPTEPDVRKLFPKSPEMTKGAIGAATG